MRWYTVARISDHQELTPEGFLLVKDVPIARTGTQLYRDFELPDLVANGDGWISVDREPSEVFREDSISSFHGKPITDNHPNDVVTPDNWSQLAIGHMQHVRRGGPGNSDVLVADLLFTTSRGIQAVRSGKRALSVGYDAYYEQTSPGLARQRNIVANHLALVDEGRCGARCTIVDGVPAYSDNWLNTDAWEESEHPRGQPENAGQFAKGGGGAKAEPMPRLGWQAKTPEGRQDYAKIKRLAERVTQLTGINKYEWLQENVTLRDLQEALKDLHYLRQHETGLLAGEDKKIAETLNREIVRRQDVNQAMRQKRADDYAYMDDSEITAETGLPFEGDSRMKPGMKRQLGLLPVSHIKALARNKMTVRAVQELPPMSEDHAYAPGMHPAGLFDPSDGSISVADEITLPDGTKRMISQRQAVLRHEIGHAIDAITEVSYSPTFLDAVDRGVAKMNPMERQAAAYWLGEEYPIQGAHAQSRVRASEMFAELYAYAFDEDADNYQSLGGLSRGRRFELFAPARQIIRKKVAEALGDRVTDRLREAA